MKPIFLLLVAALSGCASTPVARSAAVKPATAEAVASCEYLDDLAGASGRYGVFASSGAAKPRMDLMAKAESIGATHVFWVDAHDGYVGTSAKAEATAHPDSPGTTPCPSNPSSSSPP